MTARLRDPFDTIHKKDIKNKAGQVVAQVDYVGWSQSADRLDDVFGPGGWSFQIMGIGEDWVHGRLSLGDAHYENIGYAENADMDWKKEVLKDAASDAFKRCAALAGVARYLYDKDTPRTSPRDTGRVAPPSARPAVARTSTDVPEEPEGMFEGTAATLIHAPGGKMWSKELFEKAEAAGIDKRKLSAETKRLFGQDRWKVTELTDEERYVLAFELGLVAA